MAVTYDFSDTPDSKTFGAQSQVTYTTQGVDTKINPTSIVYFDTSSSSVSLAGAAMASINAALVMSTNVSAEKITFTEKSVYEGVVS